jgi:hypothetical protein
MRAGLKLLEQVQILAIALFDQVFPGDKAQGGRVDAIAQSGRSRPIIEDMA